MGGRVELDGHGKKNDKKNTEDFMGMGRSGKQQ